MRSDPDYSRKYYQHNKERMQASKAWRQKYDLDYRLRTVLRTIVQRCDDPRHVSYRWYGGKGITNFLTFEDIKFLWFRDGAGQMLKPSIDRRDSNGHYNFDNCFFAELNNNQRRAWQNKEARTKAIRDGMERAKQARSLEEKLAEVVQ